MSKLKVACFSMSIDGFGAGRDQDLANPLGVAGPELFQWFFPTRTFNAMHGDKSGGSTGIDDGFAARSFDNIGAWILGRNMFGPIRGEWPDDSWKGWWGESPPYHVPVFVLTHYPRAPLAMAGGTTFHFVTEGAQAALNQAREAAQGKDVRVGGGAATIRQYLRGGLIDTMHLALSPVLIGAGEPLLAGIDLAKLGYRCVEHVPGEKAAHLMIAKRERADVTPRAD
jgi:dihydrofolate reductase